MNTLQKLIDKYADKEWNWGALSDNPNITFEYVMKNQDKPWNWFALSSNINITWDIIEQNPDKPWDWLSISQNENITRDIVEQNPDKPWDQFCLSRMFDRKNGNGWSFSLVCNAYNKFAVKFVEFNVDMFEDEHWTELSRNPNIGPDIIDRYADKPWNWHEISRNPNIGLEFIDRYSEKLNWLALSSNKFEKHLEDYYCLYSYSEIPFVSKRNNKIKKVLVQIICNDLSMLVLNYI